VTEHLENKLKDLPKEPGVYFHKSKDGEIIYVGKAALLRNRVKQYFQKTRAFDPKTDALVAEIADIDWITVETELDALFLESEMIKRYKPRYNILLRDDKSQLFIRIPMKEVYPAVTFTRGPLDDGAEYFGPYYNGYAIRKAMKYLRRVFPYSTHDQLPKRVCLQYHLGLCPGIEEGKISGADYKVTLRKLMMYLKGRKKELIKQIEKEMKSYAKSSDFEKAAMARDQLSNLRALQRQIVFSDKEFMDLSKDEALSGLVELLGLPALPRRIEGYDISHMQGTNNVASMVVATNGLADKAQYRKFKLRIPGNNDFAHMHEALSRRFSGRHGDWPTPDLLLIDGGKGQLTAALTALEEQNLQIPTIGLAKREEEIVVHRQRSNITVNPKVAEAWLTDNDDFTVISLPKNSHIVKLLQRVRDESHRFAVSYHTHLKRTGQVKSVLDDIPGVGPLTRKKLLKAFGSVAGIRDAKISEVGAVVGLVKAKIIKAHIK
jgi:excinuclease ABC subunit C